MRIYGWLAGVAAFAQVLGAEPGWARFRLGELEVTAIEDTASAMRPELFPALDAAEFRRLAGGETALASVNVFLLRLNGRKLLLDAGNGAPRGRLVERLRQSGVAVEEIDAVLLTHLHADHFGGLLDREGHAVFPKATVHVAEPELAFWRAQAGPRGEAVRRLAEAYRERLRTFRFGEEVVPGLRALAAAGHTPGHTVFATDSLLIVGDLLHAAALQFPRPELCATYDQDPATATATRRRFYDLAVSRQLPLAGMHLPFPGVVRLRRNADGGYVPDPVP